MLSQNAICFLGFGAGQQAVAMLSKSEFTAMWMEVDSGHSVTSTKGKAIKHPGLKAISQAWGSSQVPCYRVKPSGWSWSLSLQPRVGLTISDLGILVSWKKKWNEGGLKQNLLKLFLSYYAWRKVVKKKIPVQAQISQYPACKEGYDNWLQLSLVNRVFFITFCLKSSSSKCICPCCISMAHVW